MQRYRCCRRKENTTVNHLEQGKASECVCALYLLKVTKGKEKVQGRVRERERGGRKKTRRKTEEKRKE